jgi:two-component system response regulator GlrR
MEERLGLANSASIVNSPVLLVGQTGTGRELLARAIHAAGPRRKQPFISVNCEGADEQQLERLLFGSNDPDSAQPAPGAVQDAQLGTLLMKEIDKLPARLQARLVNEIQDTDSIKGIGQVRADVRLMCTTSGDLKACMDSGQLRSDLYYLISVMPIEVPPLGRRREDLPLLVSHFLEQASDDDKNNIYTPKDIEDLATNDWPAEVRSLFDLVKKSVVLNEDPAIKQPAAVPSYEEARHQFTRDYLVQHMQKAGGNISEAARLAKRNRTDFYKLLARFRLNAGDFKPPETREPDARKGERNRRSTDRR